MPSKAVVVNSSPLITLFNSQLIGLLPQLFGVIQVPQAVWREVTAYKTDIVTRCATNPAGESLSNNTAELEPRPPLLVVQPDHHGMSEEFTGQATRQMP